MENNDELLKNNPSWTTVQCKKKRFEESCQFYDNAKILEPCWFYNNGGCHNKDGSEKLEDSCKYLHQTTEFLKRPSHLVVKKPCDRYNLEGECIWNDSCKYSHRNLSAEEWIKFYPDIPFTIKTNIKKRIIIEKRLIDLDSKIKVIEFKQEGICKDIQNLSFTLKDILSELHCNYEDV